MPQGGAVSLDVAADPVEAGIASSRDGLPIHFRLYGRGEPLLILIHGWACHQDFWREQVAPFSERYRVATLDLPGHGLSTVDADARDWSMAAFGADVASLADALGAGEVVLVGHSMGGAVALEAAARLGPRCRLLLGVDTFNEAAFYGRRPAEEIARRRAIFDADFSGTMRAMVRNITMESLRAEVVEWIGAAMAASDAATSLAVLGALLAWDVEARWPPAAPAITINSAMLAARNELVDLPALDIRTMAEVGHFPMLEAPRAFNALALSLLAERLG